jgi:hypothetical protein
MDLVWGKDEMAGRSLHVREDQAGAGYGFDPHHRSAPKEEPRIARQQRVAMANVVLVLDRLLVVLGEGGRTELGVDSDPP